MMDDAFFFFFPLLPLDNTALPGSQTKKKEIKDAAKYFLFSLFHNVPSSVKRDVFHFSKRLFVSIANEREMAGVPIEY